MVLKSFFFFYLLLIFITKLKAENARGLATQSGTGLAKMCGPIWLYCFKKDAISILHSQQKTTHFNTAVSERERLVVEMHKTPESL